MNKFKIITAALTLIFFYQNAMASESFDIQNKISCKISGTQNEFAVLYENIPSEGFATMQTQNGQKVILKFIQEIQTTDDGGCFVYEKIKKTFFHPYFELNLVGSESYGREFTRCAGSYHYLATFEGVFTSEMQEPIMLTCSFM